VTLFCWVLRKTQPFFATLISGIVSSRPWLVGPEMKTETILYYYATVKFTWLPDVRYLKADFFLPPRSCSAAIANYLSSVLSSWHASLEGTRAINIGGFAPARSPAGRFAPPLRLARTSPLSSVLFSSDKVVVWVEQLTTWLTTRMVGRMDDRVDDTTVS
jgi:hypothetical protein